MAQDPPQRDPRPDWRKSVSLIVSPVVSVRKPSGQVVRQVSPWKLAAWILLLVSLVSGAVHLLRQAPPPPAADGPLF